MSDKPQTTPTEHSPYCSKQIGPASECYICNPAIRSQMTPKEPSRADAKEAKRRAKAGVPMPPASEPETTPCPHADLHMPGHDDCEVCAEMSDSHTTDDLLRLVALAICQEGLGLKQCSCAYARRFACANELPGRMAREAIAIVRKWDAGK
jgi:hypothetical protein